MVPKTDFWYMNHHRIMIIYLSSDESGPVPSTLKYEMHNIAIPSLAFIFALVQTKHTD